MTSRSWVCLRCLRQVARPRLHTLQISHYATLQAVTPPIDERRIRASSPIKRYPDSQPPSHKPPEFRRSQLHRQYTSLLKSAPLIVFFQHNNLTASEWASIRREMNRALKKVDDLQGPKDGSRELAKQIRIQIIKTSVFRAALRVAEYFESGQSAFISSDDPIVASSVNTSLASHAAEDSLHSHSLSKAAFEAGLKEKQSHPLVPLLNGPVAILTFPSVSTEHLKAALSTLTPSQPHFPAPPKRLSPGYYELSVQTGLPKLMLLGARVERGVFDTERTKWIGTISGGIDGLRGQLIATLQGAGVGLSTSLEAASKNLYLTLDAHRSNLTTSS